MGMKQILVMMTCSNEKKFNLILALILIFYMSSELLVLHYIVLFHSIIFYFICIHNKLNLSQNLHS